MNEQMEVIIPTVRPNSFISDLHRKPNAMYLIIIPIIDVILYLMSKPSSVNIPNTFLSTFIIISSFNIRVFFWCLRRCFEAIRRDSRELRRVAPA